MMMRKRKRSLVVTYILTYIEKQKCDNESTVTSTGSLNECECECMCECERVSDWTSNIENLCVGSVGEKE